MQHKESNPDKVYLYLLHASYIMPHKDFYCSYHYHTSSKLVLQCSSMQYYQLL